MSSCRCSDISSCQDKYNILVNAAGRIQNSSTQFANLASRISTLNQYTLEAFDSSEMFNLSAKILKIDDEMVSVKNSFAGKVNAKKEELGRTLSALRSEDRDYHEEQERLAREEAERRAQEEAAAR